MMGLGMKKIVKLPVAVTLVAVLAVSACGRTVLGGSKNRVYFDGLYFPATVKPVDRKTQRASFVITLKKVTQSLNAAGQAAHFEGTRYCIEEFGTSVIAWAQDPLATTETRIPVDDRLTFQGVYKP